MLETIPQTGLRSGKMFLFCLMAHDPIDTLGKATRHNMLVKAAPVVTSFTAARPT